MMKCSKLGRRTSVAIALAITAVACVQTPDTTYEFALLGDNPYPPENVLKFEALIDDVNARPDLQWVLHVGDIQGGQPCTNELFQSRFDLYQRFDFPFVYTPGDNDWFDCVRETMGGYDEYERLDLLRSVFFPEPTRTTGGRSMPVRSQGAEPDYADFVENVMWTHGDVVYSTVHLVGLTRPPTDPAIGEHRMDAAVAWIRTTFEVARENNNAAVFIATQADPWIVWGLPPLVRRECPTCLDPRPGLGPLYSVLLEQATAFDGPVVLAVGDTHIFRVDKPLYRADGSLVENFTRVETFGNPLVHWVRVTVDPREGQVFTFHQELVPQRRSMKESVKAGLRPCWMRSRFRLGTQPLGWISQIVRERSIG